MSEGERFKLMFDIAFRHCCDYSQVRLNIPYFVDNIY